MYTISIFCVIQGKLTDISGDICPPGSMSNSSKKSSTQPEDVSEMVYRNVGGLSTQRYVPDDTTVPLT
jgi:hypothetical protein